MIDLVWKFNDMAFKTGAVSEDCRITGVVPLYKAIRERTKYKKNRGICLLSVV